MFVGHGVYLKTSIMSHSCIANTKTIMNEDLTVDVRAVTAIKRGTEITKSYVSSMEPTQVHIYSIYISTHLHIYTSTQVRQEKLEAGWYFRCQCLRCSDPLEALAFFSSVACLRCRYAFALDIVFLPSM